MTQNPLNLPTNYYLDQVNQSVTFIFRETEEKLLKAIGTGFFASINTEYGQAVYLVTAKHVLQSEPGTYYNEVFIRLNTRQGTSEYTKIRLYDHIILVHPDKEVDLAAIWHYPDRNSFDFLYIPEDFFTNKRILEEKNIRIGSRAFFTGLFENFYGEDRNYPIVRFGYISLLTDEKIELGDNTRAYLYLVECQSLGGFSGSPVFFERDRITPTKIFHSPEIYLGGIMKGHYNDTIKNSSGIARELNAGLAMVTPCYLFQELLCTDVAKKERREIAESLGKQPPTDEFSYS